MGKRGPKPRTFAAKAWKLHYLGDEFYYFLHASTFNRAKWTLVKLHKSARGFTTIRCERFPPLDNRPITIPALESLHIQPKNREKTAEIWGDRPVCPCSFCQGGQYAPEKT